MTYQEALTYLFEKLPMYQRQGPAAYKKDLTNIRELCDALDHPETSFPSIHIAGTNGKGSVSHMLASILQSAGYRTGLHTSPHYLDFRERIKIDGELIPKEWVVDFLVNHHLLIDRVHPSFFEITTAMAFQYFAQQEVDIAIVEVGLGGRFDSTNILHPLLSVITNIGYDHQQFLGDPLPEIA
ncbi:MAG: dihydrofolate synthase, partial [Bacteroidetes bacterium SW_11_45_7]